MFGEDKEIGMLISSTTKLVTLDALLKPRILVSPDYKDELVNKCKDIKHIIKNRKNDGKSEWI